MLVGKLRLFSLKLRHPEVEEHLFSVVKNFKFNVSSKFRTEELGDLISSREWKKVFSEKKDQIHWKEIFWEFFVVKEDLKNILLIIAQK